MIQATNILNRYTEAEIEEQVSGLRAQLEKELDSAGPIQLAKAGGRPGESHAIAERKGHQMEGLRSALGLGDIKEGEAFNRDLQEQKR